MNIKVADRFPIADRAAVARVVERIITELGGGSEVQAAAAVEVSQPTLNRLKRASLPAVARHTVGRLHAAARRISEQLAAEFVRSVEDPEVRRLVEDGFVAWCGERQHRVTFRGKGDAPCWQMRDGRPAAVSPEFEVYRFRDAVRYDLRMRAFAECRHIMETFHSWMQARGVHPDRTQVAIDRILEPLAETYESAFIERHVEELSAKEFRDFIEAGIRREKIMLNRETDIARAAAAHDGRLHPPMDVWGSWLLRSRAVGDRWPVGPDELRERLARMRETGGDEKQMLALLEEYQSIDEAREDERERAAAARSRSARPGPASRGRRRR